MGAKSSKENTVQLVFPNGYVHSYEGDFPVWRVMLDFPGYQVVSSSRLHHGSPKFSTTLQKEKTLHAGRIYFLVPMSLQPSHRDYHFEPSYIDAYNSRPLKNHQKDSCNGSLAKRKTKPSKPSHVRSYSDGAPSPPPPQLPHPSLSSSSFHSSSLHSLKFPNIPYRYLKKKYLSVFSSRHSPHSHQFPRPSFFLKHKHQDAEKKDDPSPRLSSSLPSHFSPRSPHFLFPPHVMSNNVHDARVHSLDSHEAIKFPKLVHSQTRPSCLQESMEKIEEAIGREFGPSSSSLPPNAFSEEGRARHRDERENGASVDDLGNDNASTHVHGGYDRTSDGHGCSGRGRDHGDEDGDVAGEDKEDDVAGEDKDGVLPDISTLSAFCQGILLCETENFKIFKWRPCLPIIKEYEEFSVQPKVARHRRAMTLT